MSPEPTVDQLIQAAHAQATSDDPLDLLDAMLALTRDVSTGSDAAGVVEAVQHGFVQAAPDAGSRPD
ncbi:hypothetical protein O3S80_47860, partial [Streptomyces sp. Lzd4kr]|nr:hypothetical protein [Streptomyces sp. Lzd4kr]